MVMEEMPTPRDTHVLIRGEYDKHGAPRSRPACPARCRRLPQARRTTASASPTGSSIPDNPLTARVAVNRYWQMLFGTGLVKTVEDFGAQGEWPSHPELLDWLAVEFIPPGSRLGQCKDAC